MEEQNRKRIVEIEGLIVHFEYRRVTDKSDPYLVVLIEGEDVNEKNSQKFYEICKKLHDLLKEPFPGVTIGCGNTNPQEEEIFYSFKIDYRRGLTRVSLNGIGEFFAHQFFGTNYGYELLDEAANIAINNLGGKAMPSDYKKTTLERFAEESFKEVDKTFALKGDLNDFLADFYLKYNELHPDKNLKFVLQEEKMSEVYRAAGHIRVELGFDDNNPKNFMLPEHIDPETLAHEILEKIEEYRQLEKTLLPKDARLDEAKNVIKQVVEHRDWHGGNNYTQAFLAEISDKVIEEISGEGNLHLSRDRLKRVLYRGLVSFNLDDGEKPELVGQLMDELASVYGFKANEKSSYRG